MEGFRRGGAEYAEIGAEMTRKRHSWSGHLPGKYQYSRGAEDPKCPKMGLGSFRTSGFGGFELRRGARQRLQARENVAVIGINEDRQIGAAEPVRGGCGCHCAIVSRVT